MIDELYDAIAKAIKIAEEKDETAMLVILHAISGAYLEDKGETLRPIMVKYCKEGKQRCLNRIEKDVTVDFSSYDYEQIPRENL